jgi:hypothetical protein
MTRRGGRSVRDGVLVSVGQTTHRPEPGTTSSRPAPPHAFILDGHLLRELRRQHGLSQKSWLIKPGLALPPSRGGTLATTPCRGRIVGRLAGAVGENLPALTLPRGSATLA